MEFISLPSLITIGIVIFILVLYRYFDKNNRSLEKVKRFSDKVKNNLSGFIDDKTQEIRNLSIDMQVNLKTAKEILKRISDIEQELKKKAESMDTLQSKVNKYDSIIHELNNATIVVEENLKRIHDESAFIDKVGKRVKTAQTKLEQLEKQVPSIREEMKKQNCADLKAATKHLTDDVVQKINIIQESVHDAGKRVKDFSVYLTRLEGRRETMEQESIKKFDTVCNNFEAKMLQKKTQVAKKFKEEMSHYFQEVNTKRDEFKNSMDELVQGSMQEITDLEDRMLKHLIEFKKDIDQAELNFKKSISKVVESGKDLEHEIFIELRGKIKEDSEKVRGEVEKRLTQFTKEVEVRNNEIITILGKSKQNIEVWKTGIAKRIENLKSELNTHFMNCKAEVESNINEYVQKNQDEQLIYEAQLQKFIQTSESKMQILEAEYSKKIEDMNQGFSVFTDDYSQRLKEIDEKVDKEKEQLLINFDEKMGGLEKQCAVRFEHIKNDFTKIDGLGDDIKFRIKNISKDLQECSCDLLGRIDEFKSKFSQDLNNASSEVETSVIKNVEQRISEYENDASYRFEKLERVQTDIELLEQGLRELMEVKKEDLKSDFAGFITLLEERKKEEREHTNTILSEIRIEIQKLDDEVHELKSKAYQNVSEKLKIFEDDFFADLRDRSEAMENSLNEWQSTVKDKLDSIDNKHTQERLLIEEQYNEELKTGISTLDDKTQDFFKKFKQKWQDTLSSELDTYKLECNQTIEVYREEMKGIIIDIKDTFSLQRDDLISQTEEERNTLKAEIHTLTGEVDAFDKKFITRTKEVVDSFNSEYKQKQEEFTMRLRELQGEFEEKIKEFKAAVSDGTTHVNNVREEYIEKIDKGYNELSQKLILIDEKQKELMTNVDVFDKANDFITKLNKDLGLIKKEMTAIEPQRQKIKLVEHEFQKIKEKVESSIIEFDELGNNIRNKYISLENKTSDDNNKLKEVFQGLENELNRWHEELDKKVTDYTGEFDKEIGGLQSHLVSELNLLKEDYTIQRVDIIEATNQEREEMKNDLNSLDERLNSLKTELNDIAENALNRCQSEYRKLQKDFFTQSKTFEETMEKKITGFEAAFKSDQEKIKQIQEKYAAKVNEEYRSLADNLREIDRQQQSFISQTKLFERADSLKLTLKNELDDLRKDIRLLEPVRKKMKTLETELTKMNKLTDDINIKTSKYSAEKRRIDNMEKNFNQLLKISDNIDEKLESVTTAYDTLQEIKIRIRELGELGREVQLQYERLEKKKEVIETTTSGVDKSFKVLEDLEKEIKKIEENVESLPPRIITLDQEIKYLLENKPKADHAVEQMQSLTAMMTDIEQRTEKLNNAREWLARTETRLQSIGKNAQDQLKLLQALIKEDGSNGKKSKGAPKQDKREMIVKLARQGWSSKEISKATNTSLGEVELILELEPKKR